MILVVAATEIEMAPFIETMGRKHTSRPIGNSWKSLIAGVGPVSTMQNLTRHLLQEEGKLDLIVNLGIAGAYIQPIQRDQPQLLDLCLAQREILGDFGICLENEIDYLDPGLTGPLVFDLGPGIKSRAMNILTDAYYPVHEGTFITVNSVTGTRARGDFLQQRWGALCENMEGASVAKLCAEFSIPCVELRCISNYVEDRDPSSWKLSEACDKVAEAGVYLVNELIENYEKFA